MRDCQKAGRLDGDPAGNDKAESDHDEGPLGATGEISLDPSYHGKAVKGFRSKYRQGLRWAGKGRAHLGRPRWEIITESRQEPVTYTTVGAVDRLKSYFGGRISGQVLD